MPTTVYIERGVGAEVVAEIQALLDEVALRDPNWNGANFVIERGDYTEVDDKDEYAAAELYNQIVAVIRGEV